MFHIGDQVCYPMHGIGIIERIEEQSILGEQAQYYILTFNRGSMTAMVPVSTAESVGVRLLSDSEGCRMVLEYFSHSEVEDENDNWNQRYRDNMDKLRKGDIFSEAQVVKNLAARDRLKGLSTGERKMYSTAKQILFAEMGIVLGLEESDLESCLQNGLSQ